MMSTSITPVLTSNDGTVMISAVNANNLANSGATAAASASSTTTSLQPTMTVTPVTLDHLSSSSNASTTTMSITATSYPPSSSLFTSSSATPATSSMTITTSALTNSSNNNIGNSTNNSSINNAHNAVNHTTSTNELPHSHQQPHHQQQQVNPVILTKQRLQELVTEIDPKEQLDEEVEDTLLSIADDFIENLITSACQLAKHRGSKTVDVKDVQLILEKNYNMLIPGFGSLPLFNQMRSCYKKSPASEAHKQRMGLIKKTLKKI